MSSFWHLESVINVTSNWDIFLKNWKWFSNSANNKGFFNWNDNDLFNFNLQCNRDFWDCLAFDKMKIINFK